MSIKFHLNRGFTLAEVLIGVVILAIGLLAVMGLHMTSIRGKMFSNSLTLASVHAQEGLETLKSLPLYKADGVTLEQWIERGRVIREKLLEETYGIKDE